MEREYDSAFRSIKNYVMANYKKMEIDEMANELANWDCRTPFIKCKHELTCEECMAINIQMILDSYMD